MQYFRPADFKRQQSCQNVVDFAKHCAFPLLLHSWFRILHHCRRFRKVYNRRHKFKVNNACFKCFRFVNCVFNVYFFILKMLQMSYRYISIISLMISVNKECKTMTKTRVDSMTVDWIRFFIYFDEYLLKIGFLNNEEIWHLLCSSCVVLLFCLFV